MVKPCPSIVLAGDVPFLRSLVRIALEDEGLHVLKECSNPEELLDAVRTMHPDVVLLDLNTNEFETVRLIEHILDIDPEVAIVAVSEGVTGASEKVFAAGARAYLQKPFSMYDLVDLIRKVAPVF
ncbi:MAG: response regulator [Candidatus Thorarchaeota archaeon]